MVFHATAVRIAQGIDIRTYKLKNQGEIVEQDSDKLFLQTGDNSYIYIFRYGVVGFYGFTPEAETQFISSVLPYCEHPESVPVRESMPIHSHYEIEKVEFNRVRINTVDTGVVKIVLLNLAHSVILDHYTSVTESLLVDSNQHTYHLEQRGKLGLKGNKLIRYIAKVMNIKNRIAQNLYVLDNTDITWENERLHRLDMELKINFDINDRNRHLEDQLAIVKENLELFKDIVQHRESTQLEWIIIVLILIEVIDTLWIKFS